MTRVPPPAAAILSALAADPAAPVKAVVIGGLGTGKSTVLAEMRDLLRAAGIAVLNRPPHPDESPRAVVVDDADELTDAQLAALTDLAGDPAVTLIVATQPRERRAALHMLIAAIEGEQPRISLRPLSSADVGHRLTGGPELDALMSVTAGLPFLLESALPVAGPGGIEAVAEAVHAALVARLRRYDEPALAALLVMSLDHGLGPTDIAGALGVDPGAARDLVDICYAGGLLEPAHGTPFTMSVHRAAAQLLGATRHREIETALLCSQDESSSLSTILAIALAEHGLRHPRLAAALAQRATDPQQHGVETVRLLRSALSASGAGAPDAEALTIRLADATARNGDCPAAAALTDRLLDSADARHRTAAVRIAASVATHDGNTGQAADLYRWLGQSADYRPTELDRAAGTIVLVAAGEPEAARKLLDLPGTGPPTSAARASRNLAAGLVSTLDQPYPVAAAHLGQALGADMRITEAMPDSAPALLALAALHSGDPARARSVIARAVTDTDADEMFGHRHRLLLAWVQMQDGQSPAGAAADPDTGMHRRDALWAAALQTAIARRSGDTGSLQRHWAGALDVLAEYCVDLFSLLPIGELWIAAARLHQTDRMAHTLDQAFALLRTLGDPPGWSLPLHWAGVHVAILGNSPESMARHGQALSVAAGASAFAEVLAGGGRAWLRVLARQVDVDEISVAARGLARFGLTSDATRLAGQAALQAPDPRVSSAMLQVARDLKLMVETTEAEEPAASIRGSGAGRSVLSEREREVAQLLLLGMPYRDIGAQLFISAKTVEHHVARIRRRIGADSRSEMLSMLRAMMASSP